MFLPVHYSHMVKPVRVITHQYIFECFGVFVVGINLVDFYQIICHITSPKNDSSIEHFSYSCNWMRSKIIGFCLLFVYTHIIYLQYHIYTTIPYIEYMVYDKNCDNIVYGVYSRPLIISFRIWHIWCRECDTNHK